MKAKEIKKSKKPKRSKDNWERAGYYLIGLGLLVMFTTLYFQFCTTVEATFRWTILSAGIGIVGIGIAMIAKGIAEVSWKIGHESGKRMEAMANLEFYEKIAVVEAYVSDIYSSDLTKKTPTEEKERREKALEAHADRIYYDIKGAKQLNKYVDPQIRNKLKEEIDKLKNIASKEAEKYKELIEKNNELQKEDR